MSFKDQIAADMAMFLDAMEFSDSLEISVAGETPVQVIAMLEEGSDEESAFALGDGLLLFAARLYIRTDDLPRRPKVGKDMAIDGRAYRVLNTSDEMGLTVITLERADS